MDIHRMQLSFRYWNEVVIDTPPEEGFEKLWKWLSSRYSVWRWSFLGYRQTFWYPIPSVNHSNTIANFIGNYYVNQNWESLRFTSLRGLIELVLMHAKHGYAHARLISSYKKRQSALFRSCQKMGIWSLKGRYHSASHRDEDSIITRRVARAGNTHSTNGWNI